jgi:hypothetical protein
MLFKSVWQCGRAEVAGIASLIWTSTQTPNNRFERSRGSRLRWAKEGVDDVDKSASLVVDATSRRSALSQDTATLRMNAKISVGLLLLTLVGCYMPTRDRICKDLRVPPTHCKDDASLRNAFLIAFPIGTQTRDLRKTLNGVFSGHDPLTQLHEYDGSIDLLAQFDVHGIAACKEKITVRFQTANEALTDIAVVAGQTCL